MLLGVKLTLHVGLTTVQRYRAYYAPPPRRGH